ncbi:MAG: hypothetical protein V3V08_18585 [Nannocystaceae bacterium]
MSYPTFTISPHRAISFVVFLTMLALTIPRTIHAAEWTAFGPAPLDTGGSEWAGRMVALATHPIDPDVILAGAASGGLWRWESGTWAPSRTTCPSLPSV